MDDVTRRTMLWGAGASVAATGLVQEAAARTAAFGPDDPYDLVVRGGEVLDPSQNLKGKRDIGIRNAAIAAVELVGLLLCGLVILAKPLAHAAQRQAQKAAVSNPVPARVRNEIRHQAAPAAKPS